MEKLFYDRFSSYSVDLVKDMATVPEAELQQLIEFANLAVAAGPAQCNHPADCLQAFDLIMDCCVCGECGAVLKNYTDREALALGIASGWTKLGADLLTAELRRAFGPAIDLLESVQGATSKYGDCKDVMDWGECAERATSYQKLHRVR